MAYKHLSLLAFPISLLISTVLCQTPIPKKPLGFVFNNGKSSAPVHLEIYADLTCPDCQQAWPTIKQVAEVYGPDKVRVVFQSFPLPYHTNSFVAAQSVAVAEGVNATLVFPWIDVLFKNQNQLYNFQTMDKNRFDINNIVASLAPKADISQSAMKDGLSEASYEGQARLSWKHGCSKTVASTPSFFINDVIVNEADASWTLDQWKKLIDSLLQK
ncbi:uncharacterized protein LOC110247568 [Exaiptasia diaphana]|uniref:Thioredoxin domain-containing protein n=1 Tax=Exaiptasia diaphana TaxID=2652724 RepID=A0A913XTW3_EXADI|nr:uncharacterized protein LOC110247568 [Exaiptasia diaphana]KXJ29487.1 hypothetical protein AC249_AIPGENE27013 [Exaiptasia diaphana]